MKKITIIAISTIFAVILFGVSSFAANNIASDVMQGVGNVVRSTGNVIGGAITGVTDGVRNAMSHTENTSDTENTMGNTTQNRDNSKQTGMTTDTNNGNYNATRTATTRIGTDVSQTFLGMNATAWGWLIMATVGIVTIALVWYYAKERETSYKHDDNY